MNDDSFDVEAARVIEAMEGAHRGARDPDTAVAQALIEMEATSDLDPRPWLAGLLRDENSD